jgi:transposase
LARKVLCILHHLLVHREEYREDGVSRPKWVNKGCNPTPEMTLDKMIEVLMKAGYVVERMTQEEAISRSLVK